MAGAIMITTRRRFLFQAVPGRLAGVGAFLAVPWLLSGAPPQQQQVPQPFPPGLIPGVKKPDEGPALPNPKVLLKENQKEIKKDVEQLYKLAQQLKEESEKTDSANMLSLPMLREAAEIEKLAKKIKDREKGP